MVEVDVAVVILHAPPAWLGVGVGVGVELTVIILHAPPAWLGVGAEVGVELTVIILHAPPACSQGGGCIHPQAAPTILDRRLRPPSSFSLRLPTTISAEPEPSVARG